jgi:ribonuclease HI
VHFCFEKGPSPSEAHDIEPGIGIILKGCEFDGTLKGRVITKRELSESGQGYVGAVRRTNNTAELQAIVELLLFLLAQLDSDAPILEAKAPFVTHSDSRYAVDIIRNGTRSSTNLLIRDFMVQLWKRTRDASDIRIAWVRGHTNDVGNEMADKLVGEGADEGVDPNLKHWRPWDWGFPEFRRNNYPKHFAAGNSEGMFVFKAEKKDEHRRCEEEPEGRREAGAKPAGTLQRARATKTRGGEGQRRRLASSKYRAQ